MACRNSRNSEASPSASNSLAQPCLSNDGASNISDSEDDSDDENTCRRRVSVRLAVKSVKSLKEGYLMKQSPFQRAKKRFCKVTYGHFFYTRNNLIFDDIELANSSVAEISQSNVVHSLKLITPARSLIFSAETRCELEQWIHAIQLGRNLSPWNPMQLSQFSSFHQWFVISHIRPTYCNICGTSLGKLRFVGLSCEICKMKVHKTCAAKKFVPCKWTTMASLGTEVKETEDKQVIMPHQWIEGNLPVGSKCTFCEKTAGSVMRLQDMKCLWCRVVLHSDCLSKYEQQCNLGDARVSVLPPININHTDDDGFLIASSRLQIGLSPLLCFVNSKSGNNQGIRFMRKLKQFLNPIQIYNLSTDGPMLGMKLFSQFNQFRVLVCGGDGSIGWVLGVLDELELLDKCKVGVLPLGTGNDLSRVLGWGSHVTDQSSVETIIDRLNKAHIQRLDRWSMLAYVRNTPSPRPSIDFHFSQQIQTRFCDLRQCVSECRPVEETIGTFTIVSDMINGQSPKESNFAVEHLLDRICRAISDAALPDAILSKIDRLQNLVLNNTPMMPMPSEFNISGPFRTSSRTSKEQPLQQQPSRSSLMKRRKSKSCGNIVSLFPVLPTLTENHHQKPSFIEEMLRRQARVTIEQQLIDVPVELFSEKTVINNYFGIGLDAKISLDFHNKREHMPDKCRSKTQNFLWYGWLGTKEIVQNTFKNLEQRVRLWCDDEPVSLPSLQGIVLLNIASYMGGVNFWGVAKGKDFLPPSMDDKLLEVVVIYGAAQIAQSRVIQLQGHRIRQCSKVKVAIIGSNPIPVQVDGEAWLQSPGVLLFQHKNRAQVLARNPEFESIIRNWNEGKREGSMVPQPEVTLTTTQQLSLKCLLVAIMDLLDTAKKKDIRNELLDQLIKETMYIRNNFRSTDESIALELLSSLEEVIQWLAEFLERISDVSLGYGDEIECHIDVLRNESKAFRSMLNIAAPQVVPRRGIFQRYFTRKPPKPEAMVIRWTLDDVCQWLASIDLEQYSSVFRAHDITGGELIGLESTDLREIGIKVGHQKRILNAIDKLREKK